MYFQGLHVVGIHQLLLLIIIYVNSYNHCLVGSYVVLSCNYVVMINQFVSYYESHTFSFAPYSCDHSNLQKTFSL